MAHQQSVASAAYDKGRLQCRDGDKACDNPSLPSWARLPINRCNLPAVILGSYTFSQNPTALVLDGVAELHRDFFRQLAGCQQLAARRQLFEDYMTVSFRLAWLEEAGLAPNMPKGRGKLNYLKLIRGWHFNADSMEGAVLKGWVESRFGLLPRHHGAAIRDFSGEPYRRYLEQRAAGLYNTNALEAQLDLLYTWTQIELAQHHIGEDFAGTVAKAATNSGRGLVAACLDSQNINAAGGHARPCGFQ